MAGDIVEDFYGVYLLYCNNPKFKGRTYIGFTTDPNRRIKQHNQGVRAGGALRTNNKGPWEMVLIVHGFPNDISALRFEWAWTYPQRSRRLKDAPKKKTKENRFTYSLRILGTMLQTKPWARLPLTLRWLKQEYYQEFPPGIHIPVHMPIAYGPVKPFKPTSWDKVVEDSSKICFFCKRQVDQDDLMRCLSASCELSSHIICLADDFLRQEGSASLLPVEGTCPDCGETHLWGDLIRLKKGCYRSEKEDAESHWTDSLSQVR